VDALTPGTTIADTEIKGFVARCLPSGVVTYGFRYRNRVGRRRWFNLGMHGNIAPDQARSEAKIRAGEVAAGRDPVAEVAAERAVKVNTVDTVLDQFLERYARNKDRPLRSADEIERAFKVYVRREIGSKSIYHLQRRDIVALLDKIEDENGPVMADRVLAYLRKCFNWHATRDDAFNSPIVKGMARTKPGERARSRVLDDQELRDLWRALDALGDDAPACYPTYMRTLLLTAQRRENVATMRSEEIAEGTWIIPPEKFKTKIEHAVPLTATVTRLVAPRRNSGYVFSTDGGKRAFSGFSKAKAALDRLIAVLRKSEGRSAMPHWTHHDLRRTARSLMGRAGVADEIADRVVGHKVPGPRGVYNRYAYLPEKCDGLEKLAALVERILDPGPTVVKFPKRRP
jgi:integrase